MVLGFACSLFPVLFWKFTILTCHVLVYFLPCGLLSLVCISSICSLSSVVRWSARISHQDSCLCRARLVNSVICSWILSQPAPSVFAACLFCLTGISFILLLKLAFCLFSLSASGVCIWVLFEVIKHYTVASICTIANSYCIKIRLSFHFTFYF